MNAINEFKRAQERLLRRFEIDASSDYVEIPAVDGQVHVLRCGEGPSVVMVPGFGDPAAMWAPLIAGLDDFTVYAVDRPCFGLTGSAEYTTETFRSSAVDFLEGVLDALDLEQPLFIGNSIGSHWTLLLALQRPERVAAMVHIGCPAFILGTSAPLPMRLLSTAPLRALMTRMPPPSPAQVEGFAKKIGGEDLSELPELRDLLVAAQKLPGAQRSTLELLHAVVRLRGARPEVRLTEEELARIEQPVQLIWGEKDAFGSPDIGAEAARVFPRAELHIIADGGHVPWVGHPEEVAGVAVPFLRNHSSHVVS